MKKNNALATFIDEKYIPLDKKIKLVIAVVLFILPVVLFYFFWFQPQNAKAERLNKQKTKIAAKLNKAKQQAKNKPKLEAELKEIEELFEDKYKKLLPEEKEIPALLTNISALGRGAGLDFLTFKPKGEVQKMDFIAENPVDIKVRGPYHNMGIFLDQVSKLERIVTVDNITMGGPKEVGGEMLLNSGCQLVTYTFNNVQISDPKGKKGRRR